MNQNRWAISCRYWLVSVLLKENGWALVGVSSELKGSKEKGVELSISAISKVCSARPMGNVDSFSYAESPVIGRVTESMFRASSSSWGAGAVVLVLVAGGVLKLSCWGRRGSEFLALQVGGCRGRRGG